MKDGRVRHRQRGRRPGRTGRKEVRIGGSRTGIGLLSGGHGCRKVILRGCGLDKLLCDWLYCHDKGRGYSVLSTQYISARKPKRSFEKTEGGGVLPKE